MAIGILAYGSLLDEPGCELADCVVRCIAGLETPFPVEFARKSSTRCGAPTLVPVSTGGASLSASVLVLRDGVSEESARDLLYRRERWRIGKPDRAAGVEWIHTLSYFREVDLCLYAKLDQNITPLTIARLAELAIASASTTAGKEKRDGISYLEQQKRRGIVTPLMAGYEAEVLARTGGADLCDAWARVRARR